MVALLQNLAEFWYLYAPLILAAGALMVLASPSASPRGGRVGRAETIGYRRYAMALALLLLAAAAFNVWRTAAFGYIYGPVLMAAAALVGPSLAHLWVERRKVFAIAAHSFRESIRKKTLVAAAIAAVIILGSTPFVHAMGEPGAKLKMVQFVCIIALNVFGCLVAVVMGAFSLPVDIADKTIYSVITKPIRRECVAAGKIFGLAGVTLLSFACVAIVSLGAIKLAAAREGDKAIAAKLLSGRRYVKTDRMEAFGDNIRRRREGRVWLPAQKAGVQWSFTRLHEHGMPANTVSADIYAMFTAVDVVSDTIPVTVSVSNPATGENRDIRELPVKDMKLSSFEFPASLISQDGEVEITLTAERGGDWLAVRPEDLRLQATPGGFVANFLRCMVLLGLQFILVVVISVAGSTFLSARVSVLFSVFVVFCGYINDFIRDLATAAFVVVSAPHVHDPSQVKSPSLAITFLDNALKEFMNVFSAVAPDFREFSVGSYLVDGLYVPPLVVGRACGYMLVYAMIAFAFAKAVLMLRELE